MWVNVVAKKYTFSKETKVLCEIPKTSRSPGKNRGVPRYALSVLVASVSLTSAVGGDFGTVWIG